MSTTVQTPQSIDGEAVAKNTVVKRDIELNQAIETFISILALQKKEWAGLRSTNGITLIFDNFRNRDTGHNFLIIGFGLEDHDVVGDDDTGEITIDGVNIDDIFLKIMELKTEELEKK